MNSDITKIIFVGADGSQQVLDLGRSTTDDHARKASILADEMFRTIDFCHDNNYLNRYEFEQYFLLENIEQMRCYVKEMDEVHEDYKYEYKIKEE